MSSNIKYAPGLPRPCRLAVGIVAGLFSSVAVAAPNVEFNPQFLQGAGAEGMDLSRFERGEDLPGMYSADIKVNGTVVGRREVEVRVLASGGSSVCLTPEVITLLGVDSTRFPAGAGTPAGGATQDRMLPFPEGITCEDIGRYIPDASASFESSLQLLSFSIPQAYLVTDPRGWVAPELWDDGINAALLGYNVIHQSAESNGFSRQSTTATLNSGFNVGAWRLRHDGYYSAGTDMPGRYNAGRTYAKRSLGAKGFELTVGESNTRGDLFDTVSYRGVGLVTDPRVLPDSQRDYAPVVRGVAQTNATVVVRQRDQIVYQANVAPGPFEISDLYGTAYAGDLLVEVTESDGRVQNFTVSFASVPQLLRAGQKRVSATVGTLRDNWFDDEPVFVEATLRRGLSNTTTAFGGAIASEGYAAVLMGAAVNTRIGAFSGDVTLSQTQLPVPMAGFGSRMQGQSYRMTYSKDIAATDTNIAMAAYRYSTDGYLTLSEGTRLREELRSGGEGSAVARQRSRLDLTVNQRLGDRGGSLYASGSSVDYWNLSQRRTNFAVGYSNTVGAASFSISAQRSLERNLAVGGAARESNSFYFNMNMPLGRPRRAPRANISFNQRADGGSDYRVGVTGNYGARNQGSYGLATHHSTAGEGRTFDANVGYQARMASFSAGLSGGGGSRGYSAGASGGVIVHGGGVVFSQLLSETVGVVQVPGAAGAQVGSGAGLKTNAKGYAVVPYLTPFRRNEVTIDPAGLPWDIELQSASARSVPTAGAVVKMFVPTTSGRSALIEAPMSDGKALPFGVDVYNEAGDVVGVVGQASRLWVRGIDVRGRLFVRLGGDAGQCVIDYDAEASANMDMLTSQCTFVAAPVDGSAFQQKESNQ